MTLKLKMQATGAGKLFQLLLFLHWTIPLQLTWRWLVGGQTIFFFAEIAII